LLGELRIEQRKARNALASLCFVQKAKHKLNNAFLSFHCSMRSSSSKKARYWVHGKDGQCSKKRLKKKLTRHQSILMMSKFHQKKYFAI
jgi:hypothetical protein